MGPIQLGLGSKHATGKALDVAGGETGLHLQLFVAHFGWRGWLSKQVVFTSSPSYPAENHEG